MARTALEVVIAADPRSLERGLSRAGKATDKFGKDAQRNVGRADKSFRGLGGAAKAAGAAIVGSALVSGIRDVALAAAESEKAEAKLSSQLKASGISFKAHRSEIDAVIQKHSRLAGLDDEDLSGAFTNLVRATGSVDKSMRGLGIAADIARAKNIDVSKAGELVGKVYNGNIGALSRYGITLDKNATSTEAIAALQQRFAGQAEAYGKTSAGAFDRVGVATENLKEQIGAKLAPALASAANAAARFIEGDGLANAFNRVKSVVGPVVSAIGNLIRGFREGKTASVALVGGLGAVVAGFVAFKIVTTVTKAIAAARLAILAMNVALRANPIGLVVTALAALGVAFVTAYKKSETFRRIVDGVFNGVKDVARSAIRVIIGVFDKYLGGISSVARAASKLPLVGDKFKGVADAIDKGREKLRSLNGALDDTNGKKVKARVDVEIKPRILSGVDAVTEAVRKAAKKAGDGIGISTSPGSASASLRGANSALSPLARVGFANGLGVSARGGLRPGSITSSGNQSYHSTGEALDLSGSSAGMMRTFRQLKSRYGSRLAELIYTPGGVGIKNGRPHRYTGAVAADHYDHVHVALDLGRPGPGIGPVMGGRLTGDGYGKGDLMDLWKRAGGPAGSANLAAAVALAESGGRSNASNRNTDGSIDRGLWQINSVHGGLSTFSVLGNARAAVKISNKGRNWSPWVAYKNGAYRRFLGAAATRTGKAGAVSRPKVLRSGGLGSMQAAPQLEVDRRREEAAANQREYASQQAQSAGAPAEVAAPPTISEVLQGRYGAGLRGLDADAALAALTPGDQDDLAVAVRRRDYLAGALNEAILSGDPDAIAEFATALKGATDAVTSLDQSIQAQAEAQQRRDEVNQQIADNQLKLLALANRGEEMTKLVIAAVSGGIGASVGLGVQTPGWAGMSARY